MLVFPRYGHICCGLSWALKSAIRIDIDIFNSPNFHQFQETLNACINDLKASGNFTVRQAEPITEVKDLLWSKGLLGKSTPQTSFEPLGLYFALWSGLEHRCLHHRSQLQLCEPPGGVSCLKYREDVSKTNQGSLKHWKKESQSHGSIC